MAAMRTGHTACVYVRVIAGLAVDGAPMCQQLQR